jgi:predicted short-subunit dehydrogenase-like oxidoreductase (DUF2520 family)
MEFKSISFTGAGRVGSALCAELFKNGFHIDLIVSETESRGKLLAETCNSSWSDRPVFPVSTDLIIVAVPDHRLTGVLNSIKCPSHTVVAHTAGSFGLEVFPDKLKKSGVFYPLQTFSQGRPVSFKNLPVLIESSDDQIYASLKKLAESTGAEVYHSEKEHRQMLHLAAVIVCNFTNHMLTEGKKVALKSGFSYDILKPLISETISKALSVGPEKSQTGPAVRNDNNTIEKHLDLLSFSPELKRLYSEVTKSIISYYKEKG